VRRDILLNGEVVGRTFCKSCAFRYVRMLLWKRGYRDPGTAGKLRSSRKVTDKAFEFTHETEDSELPVNSPS